MGTGASNMARPLAKDSLKRENHCLPKKYEHYIELKDVSGSILEHSACTVVSTLIKCYRETLTGLKELDRRAGCSMLVEFD